MFSFKYRPGFRFKQALDTNPAALDVSTPLLRSCTLIEFCHTTPESCLGMQEDTGRRVYSSPSAGSILHWYGVEVRMAGLERQLRWITTPLSCRLSPYRRLEDRPHPCPASPTETPAVASRPLHPSPRP